MSLHRSLKQVIKTVYYRQDHPWVQRQRIAHSQNWLHATILIVRTQTGDLSETEKKMGSVLINQDILNNNNHKNTQVAWFNWDSTLSVQLQLQDLLQSAAQIILVLDLSLSSCWFQTPVVPRSQVWNWAGRQLRFTYSPAEFVANPELKRMVYQDLLSIKSVFCI